jgi:hypothetical protein
MSLEQARRYVLDRVNRDRAEHDLSALEMDEPAELAGQRHAEDMVKHGFTAHWGRDGSVPEQRYTEAGGTQFVQENSACFFDAQERTLDPEPTFLAEYLDKIEDAFINEKPPNDGHRKNILKPVHNKLGVGLAKAVGVEQPCMAQEFIDEYGEYDGLPEKARIGQSIKVAGEIKDPVGFGAVGLARMDPAQPIPAAQLNETSTYRPPDPYVLYFAQGFKTPRPVTVDGKKFEIEVTLDDRGKKGRYEVSIWGQYPGGGDSAVPISMRTIIVR